MLVALGHLPGFRFEQGPLAAVGFLALAAAPSLRAAMAAPGKLRQFWSDSDHFCRNFACPLRL